MQHCGGRSGKARLVGHILTCYTPVTSFFSPSPCLVCLPSLHQMRRWIWMTVSGRTSTSPRELSRCSSGSFPSLSSHTGPSTTLLKPSVSDLIQLCQRATIQIHYDEAFRVPCHRAPSSATRWCSAHVHSTTACFSASECSDYKQRVNSIKDLIKKLPKPNHDTMQGLFKHLRR